MTLEESSQPGDTVVETNSLRFLVAERDQQAVDGVQVDFTHNWLLGDRFHIRPPSHLPKADC
ncbi:hypothetical protein GCM10007416_31020 [Kroppenstedtia guangzhouensis]|uniref:Uncharacterized protein n=1 Tax=Kroppenstedtia guangzhouensis TaxID=1274356 RepID=A0ABQ1H2I0_9BACL|nr:hypothetical protein [Kroppenstedtia guangzhouensis]GGA55607.1 hypothetical protein GCM10007416_31020 [Kroppenstedtia guangzhouensis]